MADESLPRRAREARRRMYQLHERSREEGIALTARLTELQREIEAGNMEASLEAVSLTDKQVAEFQKLDAEFWLAIQEVEMIGIEANIEGSKLRFEALKHQATLAAGAIAGIAAITEVVMPQPLSATPLLWFTYVVLLTTVCCSIALMHHESWKAEHVLRTGREPSSDRLRDRMNGWAYVASIQGLSVAVLLFVIFQIFIQL